MNETTSEFVVKNITQSFLPSNQFVSVFGRLEFLKTNPWVAIPCIIILAVASLGGTFGNVLTLLAVALSREIQNVEKTFIVNLALSDLYVTAVADPMSILAKLEGENFFDRTPKLCQIIASICTISCVTSLMTIAMMSLYRYIFVCHNRHYNKIFSTKKCVGLCCAIYCIGITLVVLNQAGIGDHSFDRKSLECIWDRMATYPYTVVFSVTLVWIPCLVIGFCYLRIFLFVRKQSQIMASYRKKTTGTCDKGPTPPPRGNMQLDVAKTLFFVYAVFVTCWTPYALIMVIDANDTFPHEAQVIITTFAHLHPSFNWLIYLGTQKRFAKAYRSIMMRCLGDVCLKESGSTGNLSQQRPKEIALSEIKGSHSTVKKILGEMPTTSYAQEVNIEVNLNE